MIIIFFHVVYFLGKFVFSRSKSKCALNEDVVVTPAIEIKSEANESRIELSGLKRRYSDDGTYKESLIKFSPPAYIQRYLTVENVLNEPRYNGKLKKIVDLGCSELGFFYYLKYMNGVEEILFVDIDRDILEMYKDKAQPLNADYLHTRQSPLLVRILEGSVTDPDKLLENTDAVVCIELIEHLYPEHLTMLPYNIFGYVRPKVVIITTPNADFNVLFERMGKFRHADHKFEWTRQQFQDWADNVISRFPEYSVSFDGICKGPTGTENLGACSQMAVFHKIDELNVDKVIGTEGLFKAVIEYEYPFKIDSRTDEEKIRDDAIYYMHKLSLNQDLDEISLADLVKIMSYTSVSLNYLKTILQNNNWTVVDREYGPVVLVPPLSCFSSKSGDSQWLDESNSLNPDYWNNISESQSNSKILLDGDNWDYDSLTELKDHNTENNSASVIDNFISSTPSILSNEVLENEIITKNHSNDITESSKKEPIFTSNCSHTQKDVCLEAPTTSICTDSKYTETSTSFFSTQSLGETDLKTINDNCSINSLSVNTSMCSIFLEPTKLSKDLHIEDLSSFSDSNPIQSPSTENFNSFTNNTSVNAANEMIFDEPKYTSSPQVSLLCKKTKKAIYQKDKYDNTCRKALNVEDEESNHSSEINNFVKLEEVPREKLETCKQTVLDATYNEQRKSNIKNISLEMSDNVPDSQYIIDSGYPDSHSPESNLSNLADGHTINQKSVVPVSLELDVNSLQNKEQKFTLNLDSDGNKVPINESNRDYSELLIEKEENTIIC